MCGLAAPAGLACLQHPTARQGPTGGRCTNAHACSGGSDCSDCRRAATRVPQARGTSRALVRSRPGSSPKAPLEPPSSPPTGSPGPSGPPGPHQASRGRPGRHPPSARVPAENRGVGGRTPPKRAKTQRRQRHGAVVCGVRFGRARARVRSHLLYLHVVDWYYFSPPNLDPNTVCRNPKRRISKSRVPNPIQTRPPPLRALHLSRFPRPSLSYLSLPWSLPGPGCCCFDARSVVAAEFSNSPTLLFRSGGHGCCRQTLSGHQRCTCRFPVTRRRFHEVEHSTQTHAAVAGLLALPVRPVPCLCPASVRPV